MPIDLRTAHMCYVFCLEDYLAYMNDAKTVGHLNDGFLSCDQMKAPPLLKTLEYQKMIMHDLLQHAFYLWARTVLT